MLIFLKKSFIVLLFKKTCSLELEIAHFKLEEKNKGDYILWLTSITQSFGICMDFFR